MKKIITYFLILFVSFATAYSLSKDKLYKDISKIFNEVGSIELEFANTQGIGGTIKAEKNNKYCLELPGRTVVSDGENVWNYSHNNETVLISKFDKHSSQISIEKIFFDYLNKSNPEKLEKVTNSEGLKRYKLTLDPPDTDNKLSLEKIYLWLDTDSRDLKAISYKNDIQTFKWFIISLKTNLKTDSGTFSPSYPDDAEVIDLR